MTAPIPEEQEQQPLGEQTPPGEHAGELPSEEDAPAGPEAQEAQEAQEENAETSEDQPSQ